MAHGYNDAVIDFKVCWETADLDGDLDALEAVNPRHALLIDEVFRLIEEDRAFRLAISVPRFSRIDDPRLDANHIEVAVKAGLNILYLKVWDNDGALVSFRVIYAVDDRPPSRRILILGLMPRGDDYEPDSDFGRRILAAYHKRGFPNSGRQ